MRPTTSAVEAACCFRLVRWWVGRSVLTVATPGRLPAVIEEYFSAHDRRETDAALATFATHARVVDDGRDYVGLDDIRDWLGRASTAFQYTRTLTSASDLGADEWEVGNRLEGNFPGGVVDLRYRFTVREGRISELLIAP